MRGSGDLEFVDPDVESGAWYVYVLGVREGSAGEETFAGAVLVATATGALRLAPYVANPFGPGSRLRFEIPARAGGSLVEVRLRLYDVRGRLVRELVHGRVTPGAHTVPWDGRDAAGGTLARGTYLARLESGGRVATAKFVLLR
jgi:hypothetical protein